MKNKFLLTAAIVTAMSMVAPTMASAAEIPAPAIELSDVATTEAQQTTSTENTEKVVPDTTVEDTEEAATETPAEDTEEAATETPAEDTEEAATETPAEDTEEAATETLAKNAEEATPETPAENTEEATPETPETQQTTKEGSWQFGLGWWYQYSDGTYPANEFVEIDGATYHFDANGYMTTGWMRTTWEGTNSTKAWYHFDNSGVMSTGWQFINGVWYHFDENGEMATGTVEINSQKQLFTPSGKWVSGWTHDRWTYYTNEGSYETSAWFYANADGTPYVAEKTSEYGYTYTVGTWLNYGGKWYYLNDDSTMRAGTTVYDETNNVRYRLGNDGAMITGWYQYGPDMGDWCYANPDGTVTKGWLQYAGSWYYIDSTGNMETDEWEGTAAEPNKNIYYLGRDGKMVTGWYDCSYKSATGQGTEWMYFNADGSKYTGWIANGGKWYYIDNSRMLQNTSSKCVDRENYKKADGSYDNSKYYYAVEKADRYIFDGTGAMVTGWYERSFTNGNRVTSTTWYFADADGKGHDGWLLYNGSWYYIEKGIMLTNTYTPDGYWVGLNGIWA